MSTTPHRAVPVEISAAEMPGNRLGTNWQGNPVFLPDEAGSRVGPRPAPQLCVTGT